MSHTENGQNQASKGASEQWNFQAEVSKAPPVHHGWSYIHYMLYNFIQNGHLSKTTSKGQHFTMMWTWTFIQCYDLIQRFKCEGNVPKWPQSAMEWKLFLYSKSANKANAPFTGSMGQNLPQHSNIVSLSKHLSQITANQNSWSRTAASQNSWRVSHSYSGWEWLSCNPVPHSICFIRHEVCNLCTLSCSLADEEAVCPLALIWITYQSAIGLGFQW